MSDFNTNFANLDVYRPSSPEIGQETITPAEQHEQDVEKTAGKLEGDPLLAEAQIEGIDDLYATTGETSPQSVHESLEAQVEATDIAPEQFEAIDPHESVMAQARATQEEFTSPDTVEADVFRSIGMSEGEALLLGEIQNTLRRGEALTPDNENLIAYLGQRLEEKSGEEAKRLLVDHFGRIPGIGEMSPHDLIRFADQHAKATAIYDAFKLSKGRSWLTEKANGLSEWITGKDLVDYGFVGKSLDKLENGELLSQEEMEKLVAKAETLDDSIKLQMYATVAEDTVERLIPGANIAKDGFTAEALKSDAINTAAIGLLLARGTKAAGKIGQVINLISSAEQVRKDAIDLDQAVQDHNWKRAAITGSRILLKALKAMEKMGEDVPVGLSIKDVSQLPAEKLPVSPSLLESQEERGQEVAREIERLIVEIPELKTLLVGENIDLERIRRGEGIVGRGANAIILFADRAGDVLKLGRRLDAHKALFREKMQHVIFSDVIERGKRNGNIPDWIKTPVIGERKEALYIMGRLPGYSLNKIQFINDPAFSEHRRWLAQDLGLISEEGAKKLSPREAAELLEPVVRNMSESSFQKLQKAKVYKNVPHPTGVIDDSPDIVKKLFPHQYEELSQALSFLKEQGLEHEDFHVENCFVDVENLLDTVGNRDSGKRDMYMLDFGFTEIDHERVRMNYPHLDYYLSNLK